MQNLPSGSPVKPKLEQVLELMEQGIEEGRATIQGLRSSDSRPWDLVLALSGVQQELGVPSGIDFRVASNHCGQPFGRRFTALVKRRWSTRFVIPVPGGSIANLNIPTVPCTYAFATTGAESILKCSTQGARDTGGSQACASGRRELGPCSKSRVTPLLGRRFNCPSPAALRSRRHPVITLCE